MEIQVGDRITFRYTDINLISNTIIEDETSLEIFERYIEEGDKEILKIERPIGYNVVYEKN